MYYIYKLSYVYIFDILIIFRKDLYLIKTKIVKFDTLFLLNLHTNTSTSTNLNT